MKCLRITLVVLASVLCCVFAKPASAAAIGPFNVANCSGGGVTVTSTTIVWAPVGTVANTGCIDSGLGTNVTYSGGTLGVGDPGNIANLTSGGGAVNNFMTFAGTTLDFVLTALGPGSSNTVCTGLAVGQSCSAFVGSPFLLTNLGGGSTAVGLAASGTVTDGVTDFWSGSFTTQLNLTPAAIQTIIVGGGAIESTYSGQFVVASTPVPEPSTIYSMLVAGAGLLFIGLKQRKGVRF